MNPRAEAEARLGGRYDVRVLEPSPPAVTQPPWFADDPVAGEGGDGRPVVSPVPGHEFSWEQLVAGEPGLGPWCAERWLAAVPALGAPPAALVSTRQALHRVAETVLAPARREQTGKFGLRWTRGGFGTPFFGADRQLRVQGTELVIVQGEDERRHRLESLADAAAALGPGWLPEGLELDDAPLAIDSEAAAFLGQFYGFAARVLETVRADTAPAHAPSRVQLWPEHFDLAVELGAEDAGARAAYGLSPGDDAHAEPYVYVAPWLAPDPDPLWQADGFAGAELAYAELSRSADPIATAVAFLRTRREALTG